MFHWSKTITDIAEKHRAQYLGHKPQPSKLYIEARNPNLQLPLPDRLLQGLGLQMSDDNDNVIYSYRQPHLISRCPKGSGYAQASHRPWWLKCERPMTRRQHGRVMDSVPSYVLQALYYAPHVQDPAENGKPLNRGKSTNRLRNTAVLVLPRSVNRLL